MASLRPYQVDVLRDIAARKGRCLIALDMGLGKTACALTALRMLRSTTRVLVVAPKTAISVWERESATWLPGADIWVYRGTPKQRAKIWAAYGASHGGLLLTNFAFIDELAVKGVAWGTVIVDESHYLRNRKTRAFKDMKKLKSTYFLELTGSPIVNGVVDLWTQLHLLAPKTFTSFWRFAKTYCFVEAGDFGTVVTGVRDPMALQTMLRAWMLRKTKAEVLPELPPKVRQIIPVPLTAKQQALYDDLVADLMADVEGHVGKELLMAPNVIAMITRLRQICVSPALVGDINDSAMFETLREGVISEYASGRSVMVFTPFAQALPLIREALADLGSVWTLQGGLPSATTGQRVAEFQACADPNKALLCTIGVGSSFTATAAATAFFLGSAWAPAHNIQAEDRLHRLGQRDSVLVKYLIGAGTIDEHLLDILDRKTTYAALALRPDILFRPRDQQQVSFAEAV